MQIGVDCNLAVGNRRIFVVAEDEIARMAVQFMLHDEYETHEFGSLDVAAEKARDWPPDLMIVGAELLADGEALTTRFPQARLLKLMEGDAAGDGGGEIACLYKPLRLESVRSAVANEFKA